MISISSVVCGGGGVGGTVSGVAEAQPQCKGKEERMKLDVGGCSWQEFCDSCAKFAAYDFAQSWHNYLAENPNAVDRVSEQDVASKFVEAFVSYFENEARRICRSSRLLNESIISSSSHPFFCTADCSKNGGTHAQYVNSLCSSESADSDCSHGNLSCEFDLKKKRTLFSRFSYKNVKRSLFKKPSFEEAVFGGRVGGGSGSVCSGGAKKCRKKSKSGSHLSTAKTVVEVVHESGVNFVCGRELDGEKWEKGRMVLVKTVGGYLLEFYAPPKASKPKDGIFCFLLTEVRETTALETPDCDYTFVLKAENFKEYIVQVKNHREMRDWLSVISTCMDDSLCTSPLTGADLSDRFNFNGTVRSKSDGGSLGYRCEGFHSLPLRGSTSARKSHSRISSIFAVRDFPSQSRSNGGQLFASQLRRSYSSGQASNPATSVRHHLRSTGAIHDLSTCPYGILRMMDKYPWFHGNLSRSDAAALVIQSGADGHGLFLVRQSETRSGEYVLTFNCHGRVKHLRITVLARGHCRVQHLWFDSIFDMLEHFRCHQIPLQTNVREGPSNGGVLLTDYVIAWPPGQCASSRSRTSPPDPRNYVTHGGSIRMTTHSLERLAMDHHNNPPQQNFWNGRAENTYQFT